MTGAGPRVARLLALAALLSGAAPAAAHDPPEPLPPCSYDDRPARIVPPDDGRWTVLDTVFALPERWRPDDLVPVRQAGLPDDRLVRALIVPDLRAMVEDAAAAGVRFRLWSAFRSGPVQADTFDSWSARLGREAALRVSARPGHSEHQLGTAIDLGAADGPAPWDLDDFGVTPEGAWLIDHAWRYGFVLSYPRGAEDRACYAYEPWHWRWVGREVAQRIHASGALPREALWAWREELAADVDAGGAEP